MVVVEVALFEKIPPGRKGHRNIHQKLEEIWEPNSLGPKGGDQSHLAIFGDPELRKNLLDKSEWGKGISQRPVPRLKHRIDP